MRKACRILLFLFLIPLYSFSQKPPELTSSEIYQKLEKLGTLANVLYIAAHPDDENTGLISYFSNEKHYETTYLSLTRGDGGQNLIGPEIGSLLGLIRTQELLAARRVDGGSQMFTRANDFGFSKNPSEAFEIWNKEAVLHDVVWAIRKTRPDIIVNRFDHRTPGTTHGHHTGSAILSYEAFDLAGDETAFPDQLDKVEIWNPRRLYMNTSWWFYGSREKFEEAEDGWTNELNTGVYYPLLGRSNDEIAALSRSQHRCQGFGRIGARGEEKEYLELLKGDKPSGTDLLSDINTTWSRVEGGAAVQKDYEKILREYDFQNPGASTEALTALYMKIKQMPEHPFKAQKAEECLELIQACAGLYLEVNSASPRLVPGQKTRASWEAVNRSEIEMKIDAIEILPTGARVEVKKILSNNIDFKGEIEYIIPEDAPYTNPYWLNEEGSLGLYRVDDPAQIGKPETPRYLKARFLIEIAGQPLTIEREVVCVTGRPERGEVYRPVEIIPAYSVSLQNPILFFREGGPGELKISVHNHSGVWGGDTLKLDLPEGFSATPEYFLLEDDEHTTFTFHLTGPQKNVKESVTAYIHTREGRVYDRSMTSIDYEHIPLQTVLQPARADLVSLQISADVDLIGYLQGAGDDIPKYLEEIGIRSEALEVSSIPHQELKKYGAIVLGVRALNTLDDIGDAMPALLEYARNGGTLVIQYNTNHALKTAHFSPYDLHLSRDRVTDEFSPVKILNPNHPVLTTPNRITETDFENWVQERGLYFPDSWGKEFETVVSFQDPGESFLPSGLLVAPYGEGYYVYTGISFFRQLPAGVPGAFKLFVNILSLNQTEHK